MTKKVLQLSFTTYTDLPAEVLQDIIVESAKMLREQYGLHGVLDVSLSSELQVDWVTGTNVLLDSTNG